MASEADQTDFRLQERWSQNPSLPLKAALQVPKAASNTSVAFEAASNAFEVASNAFVAEAFKTILSLLLILFFSIYFHNDLF
jgi:predicted PurR-regulated permease PerM